MEQSIPITSAYKTYPIFLSSICRGELKSVRENIFFKTGKEKYIYVDEIIKKRDVKQQDDLEAIDELIQRIRESQVFVCILGGISHGTPIRIGSNSSSVSFFELELFQAALLQKQIYIFVRDGFDPEPRLKRLLEILDFYLPEWICQKRMNDIQIQEQCSRLVQKDRLTKPFRSIRQLYRPIRRLVQGFYRQTYNRKIRYLGGEFEPRTEPPNREVIGNVVKIVKEQSNEEKRLSRIWIGVRELMSAPYTKSLDLELLQYWNMLLGEWAKAGAWYGLHADTPLGCLAALNGLTDVRLQIEQHHSSRVLLQDTAYPGGALASSKYSIAKRLYVKKDRKDRFNEALDDINKAMMLPSADESGLIAIRGSIYRELGRLTDAISDYEVVLNIRRKGGMSESAIGEAMSELGFAYLKQFHFRKGLDYCREGVELLRQGVRPGFLARGLRKLSVAYLCNGKLKRAYEAKQEAKTVAMKHRAFDQL